MALDVKPREPAPPQARAQPATVVLDDPEDRPPSPPRRVWPWVVGVLVVIAVAIGSYWWWQKRAEAPAAGAATSAAKAPGGKGFDPASRALPVVAEPVRKGNIDVYLNALGTVTPRNLVTVKPRVDGQLMKVYFEEGQLVKAGQPLADIDPRPFEVQVGQAQGQMAKDQALLANAQVDLERYRTLLAQDSIAKQQVDTQESLVRQYQATIKADQSAVDQAKLQLTYSKVTAPISGRVGLRLVDPGNMIHSSDANGIIVITQLEPITVVFSLPSDKLPQVLASYRGGKALPVTAFDRDMRKQLASGTLFAVDNQIDPTTGTVKLKASFPNTDGALFPNQFVNASLLVDTLKGAVLIPAAGIQRSPQSTYVWRVKPDSTVEMRDVEVAMTEGDTTALRTGLTSGDRVVVDGVDKLQPGMRVAANEAPAGAPHARPSGGSANPESGAPPAPEPGASSTSSSSGASATTNP